MDEREKQLDELARIQQHNIKDLRTMFSTASKLVYYDLNQHKRVHMYYRFTKDDISKFLRSPQIFEHQLREACNYIYNASSHFMRLIQYFASLTDLAYIISPCNINPENENPEVYRKKYWKTAHFLEKLIVREQLEEILTVCFREDVYYGTFRVDDAGITIQRLPSDYCRISSKEGGVFNVAFNFYYFFMHPEMLEFYPDEFQIKFNKYKNNIKTMNRWIELDSPGSFAVKFNKDIPEYPVPPFTGVLREVFDIDDYKQLKLSKTELENYAILVMKLGKDKEGRWDLDFGKAEDFWMNLDSVLPEQIGSILSPMSVEKIDFENSGTTESDKITEAENNLWSAAGVSSMIFNSKITSSNALLTSIKADQALTFKLVKSIGSVINRFLHAQVYGKNFKLIFLDCSRFNRKEVSDLAFKGCQYGMPLVSMYCASLGLSQSEMMSMNWVEDKVLNITDTFKPLQSSATMSGVKSPTSGEVGRPRKDDSELSDAGEASRDQM